MHTPTSLALVDDDPAVRDIWVRQLTPRTGFHCAGSFADAESALPWLLAHPPALLLVDYQLPVENGLWLTRQVKAVHPDVRSVLITNHDLEELPLAALRAGVNGFLLKPDSPAAPPARLRAVMDGTCVFSARIMQRLSAQLHAGPPPSADALLAMSLLTAREREVLREYSCGLLTKQVADRLGISETTAKTHKESIVAKLRVKNITEAVKKCSGFIC